MFTKAIELFDNYCRRIDKKKSPTFNPNLGSEVRERLHQLDYILERVHELERIANQASSRSMAAFVEHVENTARCGVPYESAPEPPSIKMTKEEFQAFIRASFEMRLLTEAFYYFAGRIRTILRNRRAPLPGLTSFECEGARNVRNKLLEHPEGRDSGVLAQSWAWGGANGPGLKVIRDRGQKHVFPDQGLYRNAEEFRDNLERLLQRELSIC